MNALTKKAELSLEVIIVAVIVLIVLVVLVLVFTGKIGNFGETTQETEEQFNPSNCEIPGTGRYCSNTPCPTGKSVSAQCPNPGEVCCRP
ncbi:hypothetical protein D6774_00340 [Candidatus Woesearchaeota archaeon]|jgi:hypothetical protein|nr:MAG: hypothetical protein D6774_00340 [Candidatus Woesearchaeota archaeon]